MNIPTTLHLRPTYCEEMETKSAEQALYSPWYSVIRNPF
jgi:hypothetical protein